MNKTSFVTALVGGAVTVFAALPYPWAHLVSAGLGSFIAGAHGLNMVK